jgi:hypothetical protein
MCKTFAIISKECRTFEHCLKKLLNVSLWARPVLLDGVCIIKPKILIWVNFGRYCNGRCWYFFMAILSILRPNVLFYDHLVHFVVIWYILWSFWYILWSFGTFCGHLVYFSRTEKNLATLCQTVLPWWVSFFMTRFEILMECSTKRRIDFRSRFN